MVSFIEILVFIKLIVALKLRLQKMNQRIWKTNFYFVYIFYLSKLTILIFVVIIFIIFILHFFVSIEFFCELNNEIKIVSQIRGYETKIKSVVVNNRDNISSIYS